MPADPAGRDATAPEVEAVAQAFGYTPSMKRMWPEALEKAAAAIAALDRVRADSARDHDAYVEPLDGGFRGFQARCHDCDWHGPEHLRGDEQMGTPESRVHKAAARADASAHRADSARGEDHEAGIEAAVLEVMSSPSYATATPAMRARWIANHVRAALTRPSPVDDTVRLREALIEVRSLCVSGANAIEPRNVLGQVVATADRALSVDAGKPEANDER